MIKKLRIKFVCIVMVIAMLMVGGILGVVIFVLAICGVVTSVVGGGFSWQALLQALMAWAYIVW